MLLKQGRRLTYVVFDRIRMHARINKPILILPPFAQNCRESVKSIRCKNSRVGHDQGVLNPQLVQPARQLRQGAGPENSRCGKREDSRAHVYLQPGLCALLVGDL